MNIARPLLPILILLTRCAIAADSQDAPPVNAATIMANLRKLEEKQAADAKAQTSKVLQDFTTASSSSANALAFYLQAVEQTQFQGQNREHTQFQDWKKKEADKLKGPELQTAARLHLSYAVLTLRRASGATTADLLPALLDYTDDLAQNIPIIWDQPLMKQSVASSLFAKWYGIDTILTRAKDWEFSPGNLDNIYQKTILPELREKKDPRAVAYWDARLNREAAQASQSKLTITGDTFDQVRRPDLLWSRAQELLKIGQRNRAITEMFNLIKAYSAHPNAADWIATLKDTLTTPDQPLPIPPSGP